jgi:hypothetical protein
LTSVPDEELPVVEEPRSKGFGEVNEYTSGTEFYGPAATLAFLLELRARARAFQSQLSQVYHQNLPEAIGSNNSGSVSIISFLYGADDSLMRMHSVQPRGLMLLHEVLANHTIAQIARARFQTVNSWPKTIS